uniref:Uncharacterized protein n=1 Tax=Arundo donax TaxID=35708 RepID=A0A0A9CZ20_ARUDO
MLVVASFVWCRSSSSSPPRRADRSLYTADRTRTSPGLPSQMATASQSMHCMHGNKQDSRRRLLHRGLGRAL